MQHPSAILYLCSKCYESLPAPPRLLARHIILNLTISISIHTQQSSLSHWGQVADNAAQVPDQTSETSGGEREWEEEDKAAERRYQETEGSNKPELHPVIGRATLFLHFYTSIQWVAYFSAFKKLLKELIYASGSNKI